MKTVYLYITIIALTLAGCGSGKYVNVSAINEFKAYQPGMHVRTAFEFKMSGGWHIYWTNPGDAGLATSVEWILPDGFGDVATEYSVPVKSMSNDIVDYGYAHTGTLITSFRLPSNFKNDTTIELTAHVNWLRCKDICVPGGDTIKVRFPVSMKHPADKQYNSDFLDLYPMYFPYESSNWLIDFNKTDTNITFNIQPKDGNFREIENIEFFPVTEGIFSNSMKQILKKEADHFVLTVHFDPLGSGLNSGFSGIFVADKPWESNRSKAIKYKVMID